VPGGFQAYYHVITHPLQGFQQKFQPITGILDGEDRSVGLAVVIQHHHGVFAFGHIDPAVEHESTSCVQGSEATSDCHEPLSLVCFAPLSGDLLIRDLSWR